MDLNPKWITNPPLLFLSIRATLHIDERLSGRPGLRELARVAFPIKLPLVILIPSPIVILNGQAVFHVILGILKDPALPAISPRAFDPLPLPLPFGQ
jgi:hypothetical protein